MEDSRNKYIEELEEVVDGLEDEVHQAERANSELRDEIAG